MKNHTNFWLGFLSAILLSVPIFFGIAGLAEEKAIDTAVVLFIVISTLIAVFIFLVLFRDRVLKKLLGQGQSSLEEIANTIGRIINAGISGDKDRVAKHSSELSKVAISWYVWTGFYRWIIATCIGLLLAFAAFAGTILLVDQNKKIEFQTAQLERQNELQSITLASTIREMLYVPARSTRAYDFGIALDGCFMDAPETILLEQQPSNAIISSVVDLASSADWGDRILQIVSTLLLDDSSSVRLGALLVLEELDKQPDERTFSFNNINVSISQGDIRGDYSLDFTNSYIRRFDCENCDVDIYDSIVTGSTLENVKYRNSIISDFTASGEQIEFDYALVDYRVMADVNEDLYLAVASRFGVMTVDHEYRPEYEMYFTSGTNVTDDSPEPSMVADGSCADLELFCKDFMFGSCSDNYLE